MSRAGRTRSAPSSVQEPPMSDDALLEVTSAAEVGVDTVNPESANGITRMSLQELKDKPSTDLVAFAESLDIENASSMRKQDMLFTILKALAEDGVEIFGSGVLEVVQDGFGFLRSAEANYLPGPDDIYVSPSQIRRFGLRTGDSCEGPIRAPREGERYFAILKVDTINFERPEPIKS